MKPDRACRPLPVWRANQPGIIAKAAANAVEVGAK
jgi:hypothetical protein